MADLNINDTVSLGRNIIAFVNELKGLISSTHRAETRYLAFLRDQIAEQNRSFEKLSMEYFALVSSTRIATFEANSARELLEKFESFMTRRDEIVVPRSDLFGSINGTKRLLEIEAPMSLKSYLADYREYLDAMGHFFYESTAQDGGSYFNDIFQKAYYAFENSGDEDVAPMTRIDAKAAVEKETTDAEALERIKTSVRATIDEARAAMEVAREDAGSKYARLVGRLSAKA